MNGAARVAAALAVLAILVTAGLPARAGAGRGAGGYSVAKIADARMDGVVSLARDGRPLQGVQLYYGSSDGYDRGLWRSDGTAAGTRLIEPMPLQPISEPLGGGRGPSEFARSGEKVLFTADTTRAYGELWETDGTPRGTRMMRTLDDGNGAAEIVDSVEARDPIVYLATHGFQREELWRTNGTKKGTYRVTAGEEIADVETLGRNAIFARALEGDDDEDFELLRSDGSRSDPAVIGRTRFIYAMRAGGRIVFADRADGPMTLWRTDGTRQGTTRIETAGGVSPSLTANGIAPGADGTAFLVARGSDAEGGSGYALWRLSPDDRLALIEPGGEPIYPVKDGANTLTWSNGRLFFAAYRPGASEQRLWVSDGTSAGTDVVPANVFGGDEYPRIRDIRAFGPGAAIIVSRDDGAAEELWVSDGTAAGTVKVDDTGGLMFGRETRNGLLIERGETSIWRLRAD